MYRVAIIELIDDPRERTACWIEGDTVGHVYGESVREASDNAVQYARYLGEGFGLGPVLRVVGEWCDCCGKVLRAPDRRNLARLSEDGPEVPTGLLCDGCHPIECDHEHYGDRDGWCARCFGIDYYRRQVALAHCDACGEPTKPTDPMGGTYCKVCGDDMEAHCG